MKARRFTIVELLCVIGILMVLAALLLPSLHAATGRAQRVQCASNLRQLHFAFMQYAGDWEQRLPPYVHDDIQLHGGMNWANYTRPYYGDIKLLVCPSSYKKGPADTWESRHLYDGHYGWNYDGTQYNKGPLAVCVKQPSAGYLLFDSGDQCVIYGANNWQNLMEELDLDFNSRSEGTNRHELQTNIVFVDGHTSLRTLEKFLSVPNKSYTAPWYIDWEDGELLPGKIPYPER